MLILLLLCALQKPDQGGDRPYDNSGPDEQNQASGRPIDRFPVHGERLRLFAAVGHDGWGNELQGNPDAERNENQVVDVSQDRHEIGHEVNRTERVGNDAGGEPFRVPGRSRIAAGEPERDDVLFQCAGPFPKGMKHDRSSLRILYRAC